jgi:hypothetical protein
MNDLTKGDDTMADQVPLRDLLLQKIGETLELEGDHSVAVLNLAEAFAWIQFPGPATRQHRAERLRRDGDGTGASVPQPSDHARRG